MYGKPLGTETAHMVRSRGSRFLGFQLLLDRMYGNGVDRIVAAMDVDPAPDTGGLEADIERFVCALYGLPEERIEVAEEGGR